jgi:hypothetical protein
MWGCDVWWIGDGARDLNLANIPAHPINYYESPMGPVSLFERRLSMNTLLDLFGDLQFDMILHTQDWTKITGYEKSPIPYVFYHTEPFYPHGVPNAAWMVACPSSSLIEQTKNWFGVRYKYTYMPHALRDDCRQMVGRDYMRFNTGPRTRQIPVSFSGTVYSRGIYRFRVPIVDYFRKNVPGFYFYNTTATAGGDDDGCHNYNIDASFYQKNPKTDRRLKREAYMGMLSRSQYGLNIPTVYGPNYRDLEACAAGAVDLSLYTPDHKEYGFVDGVNCILYKTPEEAADVVARGYDREIALKGQTHVLLNHLYPHRVQELLFLLSDIGYIPDTYVSPEKPPQKPTMEGETHATA